MPLLVLISLADFVLAGKPSLALVRSCLGISVLYALHVNTCNVKRMYEKGVSA
jgi:hypothetical protein